MARRVAGTGRRAGHRTAYDQGVLLVLDIGNTHLRVGTAVDGTLATVRRSATPGGATPDEIEVLLDGLLRLDGRQVAEIDAVGAASTVPRLALAVEELAARRELPCLMASAATVPLQVRLEQPAEIGPDRLVNAFAAAKLHGVPAIVVDCGTATTLDAVDHAGAFVGGAIAPGMQLGLEALAARTARLPRVEPRLPDGPIGRDTAAAIRVGTVLGHRAMIEGLLARMRRELASAAGVALHDVRVIMTGGLSALAWARTVEGIDALDPDLTLRGLVLLRGAVPVRARA